MRHLCRIWERPDGHIENRVPSWGDPHAWIDATKANGDKTPTDEEFYAYCVKAGILDSWMSRGDMPLADYKALDRDFRMQWRWNASAKCPKPDLTLETAERWKRIRVERDTRLTDSDKKYLRALDVEPTKAADWKQYRQALRDIPQKQSDPKQIVWPVEP